MLISLAVLILSPSSSIDVRFHSAVALFNPCPDIMYSWTGPVKGHVAMKSHVRKPWQVKANLGTKEPFLVNLLSTYPFYSCSSKLSQDGYFGTNKKLALWNQSLS
jgi:hypothetical protein